MSIQRGRVHGGPILVDATDACLGSWLLAGWECDYSETQIMKKKIGPGETVVDIGANMGLYTILLSQLVGSGGRVFAFEPEPDSFSLLKSNIELRELGNVVAENMGIFHKTGQMPIYSDRLNRGANSMIYFDTQKQDSTIVNVTTYDDYFGTMMDAVSFVKIDAEGAEANILEGAKTIYDPRNTKLRKMIVEINPAMQSHSEYSIVRKLSGLMDAGFGMAVIARDALLPIRRADLPGMMTDFEGNYVNLWCER